MRKEKNPDRHRFGFENKRDPPGKREKTDNRNRKDNKQAIDGEGVTVTEDNKREKGIGY